MSYVGNAPNQEVDALEKELINAVAGGRKIELFTAARNFSSVDARMSVTNGNIVINQASERFVVPFHAVWMIKIS